MSEQNGTGTTTKQCRSRKISTADQKNGKQAPAIQRPSNDDTQAWKTYWKTLGQPWRTEPEIDKKRQEYLAKRRLIISNIEQGLYPFKGIKLNRADVEWLLATYENGRGPVDWNDGSQRKRYGLDLRGADLSQENLRDLPLACMQGGLAIDEWLKATEEQRNMAAVCMQEARLKWAQMQGAVLLGAQMQGADLGEAQMQEADLGWAQMQRADLAGAQMQQASLYMAQIQGADLGGAQLHGVVFEGATLSDEKYGPALLADIGWGETNLAVVDWTAVKMLGEEHRTRNYQKEVHLRKREKREEINKEQSLDIKKKLQEEEKKRSADESTKVLEKYQAAVRANRQLALVLRDQGLNEEADYFAFRAQKLQRVVLRRQRKWLKYAFSWFLSVVAGYGYRPYRCMMIYVLALIVFSLAHYIVGAVAGQPLTFLNALAVSVQSLHGRLFSFQSSNPQTLLNTIEAFVGLFIEAILVAVITQRILGK